MAREPAKKPLPKSLAPITLQNYDQMVLLYGRLKQLGNNWPFLSHDEDRFPATASEPIWDRYFNGHLGGYPTSYRLFKTGVIHFYNVPEAEPEFFDISWHP